MGWKNKNGIKLTLNNSLFRQRVHKNFTEDKGKYNYIKSDFENFPVYYNYAQ